MAQLAMLLQRRLSPLSSSASSSSSSSSSSSLHTAASYLKALKVLKHGDHCLDNSLIPDFTWDVLRGLQERGYEAYLVGGSVRDMLLKQVPKDFDVLTTAEPIQVKRSFKRCMIIGKRFPICHVKVSQKVIEVSSFSTSVMNKKGKCNACKNDSELEELKKSLDKRDFSRWENCMKRDFTINGLMYDPFHGVLYDYVGGIEDLRKMKVRTVIPSDLSFTEDIARLLRAIRIAARLHFTFSRDIAIAIQTHATSVLHLEKGRLMMEINFMLAYGAAEASIRLLWRFGVLEVLLPLQAAYFASTGFKRQEQGSNILLKLLENLDKNVAPDRPCHSSLWLALLAIHLALLDGPRSQIIVCAFVVAMYTGKGVTKAVQKAKKIQSRFGYSQIAFPEIVNPGSICDIEIEYEVLMLRDDAIDALYMMNDKNSVRRAMEQHSQAPQSNLVIISKNVLDKCEALFQRIQEVQKSWNKPRKPSTSINYNALLEGDADEISFVFSRILLNTLYPLARRKVKSH